MKNRSTFKHFIVLSLIVLGGLSAYFVAAEFRSNNEFPNPIAVTPTPSPTPPSVNPSPNTPKANNVLIKVPFTTQAPNADWNDPRQQDGCEEASVIMAWLWINNDTMTKNEAEREIIAISNFELEQYGNYHDTSAEDTVRFFKDYYGYDKAQVVHDPSIEDIKDQLRAGKIVLVPANGQRLDNPNFRGGGPVTHMVVIKGFDESKKQFITNDPGTRLGEGFVYSYSNLYGSMVNYPTGNHLSQEGRGKAMIVVTK
jgi:hypothetical protein